MISRIYSLIRLVLVNIFTFSKHIKPGLKLYGFASDYLTVEALNPLQTIESASTDHKSMLFLVIGDLGNGSVSCEQYLLDDATKTYLKIGSLHYTKSNLVLLCRKLNLLRLEDKSL